MYYHRVTFVNSSIYSSSCHRPDASQWCQSGFDSVSEKVSTLWFATRGNRTGHDNADRTTCEPVPKAPKCTSPPSLRLRGGKRKGGLRPSEGDSGRSTEHHPITSSLGIRTAT